MKQFFEEFKAFAMRGNMIDMAVGIIIGAAFSGVVQSLVNDILMPPIGRLLGSVDFADLFVNLSGGSYDSLAQAKEAGAATINYGMFINSAINFAIVAFAVFLLIKQINRLRREPQAEEVPAVPTNKECPYCISTISIRATRCPHCGSHLEETAQP